MAFLKLSVQFVAVSFLSSCNLIKGEQGSTAAGESGASSKRIFAIATKPVTLWSAQKGISGSCLLKGTEKDNISFEITEPKIYQPNPSKVWARIVNSIELPQCKFRTFAVSKGELYFVNLEGNVTSAASYPGSASYSGSR